MLVSDDNIAPVKTMHPSFVMFLESAKYLKQHQINIIDNKTIKNNNIGSYKNEKIEFSNATNVVTNLQIYR